MIAPCTHKKVHHPHGHASRYKDDGCRCEPCKAAHRRDYKARALRFAGRPGFIPSAEVRAHIEHLATSGVRLADIAKASGVGVRTLSAIRCGETQNVRRGVAEAILAASPTAPVTSRAPVDATGSQRRLQALVTLGWSCTALSTRVGVQTETLVRIIHGHPVAERSTDAQIRAVYRTLITEPRLTSKRGAERAAINATRAWGTRMGWAGPFDWEDIDTDAAPTFADQYKQGPRIDEIRELEALGLTRAGIAARLGVTQNAIDRTIDRATAKTGSTAA